MDGVAGKGILRRPGAGGAGRGAGGRRLADSLLKKDLITPNRRSEMLAGR